MTERLLADDYPVYFGYFYVADGKVIESQMQGTIKQLKARCGYTEIKNCDMAERDLL